jgi:copper chaperone
MTKLKIDGMTCGHCAMHVQKALAGIDGVTSVEVNLQAGEAEIEGSATGESLIKAVEAEGYSARMV